MDLDALLDNIAKRAMEHLEDMISVMEAAREQVSSGSRLEDIDVGRYQIYTLSKAEGNKGNIICVWSSDEYFDLFSSAASEEGVSLDDMTGLDVKLPDAEFEDGMITGSFSAFKGISVEMRNKPLELLIDMVYERLKKRGLVVSSISDGVIFYMPFSGRS
ncbi:MAG: hypothetical protein ACE14P_04895 [Methanotrichaceae archaeon]